jgi:hypothetical protein
MPKYKVWFIVLAGEMADEPVDGVEVVEATSPGAAMKALIEDLRRLGLTDVRVRLCRRVKEEK